MTFKTYFYIILLILTRLLHARIALCNPHQVENFLICKNYKNYDHMWISDGNEIFHLFYNLNDSS